jgi:hypothetical protein
MAGTAQTAGPGAPTGTAIPPSPPGSAADVADIKAGMVAAGADPTTLAPGPGSSPAAQPGAVVTAQAGPPTVAPPGYPPIKVEGGVVIPHPGSFAEFSAREYVPPPKSEDFNPNLTPAQQGEFAALRRALDRKAAVVGAMRQPDPKAVAEVVAGREELNAKIQAAAQEKQQKADAATTKWNDAQRDKIQERYGKEREDYMKAAAAQQTQEHKLKEIAATGEQTRLSTEAGSIVESNKRVRDSLGDDATAAAKTIPNLEALRALSDNLDPKDDHLTKLATVPFMGTSLLNHLASLNLVDRTKAGAIQMLQGGISGAVAQLRQGMSMGALSDRDLTFIESLGPNLYEDQATRSAVISYLQQSQRAKIRFNNEFNEEMTKPGANAAKALAAARETMDAKHPIVPQMTPEVAAIWTDPSPEAAATRKQWAARNGVKQNTLVRQPDGSLLLVR